MNRVEKIIKEIETKGLKISRVEKEAGLEKGTLRRWEKKLPKTFEMEENINKAIETLRNENSRSL